MPPSRDLFIFLLFFLLKSLSNAQELENESGEIFQLKPSIAINNSSDVVGSGEATRMLPSQTESILSTPSTQVLKPTLTVTATRMGTTRYFHPIEPQMSPPMTTFPPDEEEITTILPFSAELEDLTDENYQTLGDDDLDFLRRSGEPIDILQPSASEAINVRVKNNSEVLPKPDALMGSSSTPSEPDLENEFAEAFRQVGPNGRRRRLRPMGDGSRNTIIRKRVRMRRLNGTRPFDETSSMIPGDQPLSMSTRRPMIRRFRSTTTTPVPDPSPPTIAPFPSSNDESNGRNFEGMGTLLKKSPFRFNPNFLNSGGLTGSSISSQIEKPGPFSEKDNSYFLIEKPNIDDEFHEHANHKVKNETNRLGEERDPHLPLDFEDERSQWEKNYMNLQQHSFYGTSAEEGSGGITSLNSDPPSPNESTGDDEFVMKEKEVSEANGSAANHGSLGEFISNQPTIPPPPQNNLPHQFTPFHFGTPNMDHNPNPPKSIGKRTRQRINPNYHGDRNKEFQGPPTSQPPKLLEPEATASPADVSQPPISGPSGDGNSLGGEPSVKNPLSEQSSFSSAYAPPMDQQFGPSGTDSIFSKVPARADPRHHHRHPIFDSHFPRDPNIFPDHLPSSPSQPSTFEDMMKMKDSNFYHDGEQPHEESHISESPYPPQSSSVGPGAHFNQRQHPHPPPPPHAAPLINYSPQHSNPPPPPMPRFPPASGSGNMRPNTQEPQIVHYNGQPEKSGSYSNSEYSFPKQLSSHSFPPPHPHPNRNKGPPSGYHENSYDERRQIPHENIGPKGPHSQAHEGGSSNYENHYDKQSDPKETRPTLTLPMPGLVSVPTPPPEGLALSEVTPNRHFPPHTHSMSNNPDYEPANPPLPNGHPHEHHFDPFIQNANEFKDEGQDNHFRNYNPSGPQSEYSSNAYTGDSLLHFHPEGHEKEQNRYEDYRDEGVGPNGPYEGRPGPPRPRPSPPVTKKKPSYKPPKKSRSKNKPTNTQEESESYLVEEENEPNGHFKSYDEDDHHQHNPEFHHDFHHDDSMFGPGPDEFNFPDQPLPPKKKHRQPSRPPPESRPNEEESEESESLKEEKGEGEEESPKEPKDAKKAASKNPYSQVPYVLMFHNMLGEDQTSSGVIKGLKSPTTGKEMSLGSASSISSLGPDGLRTGEIKNLGPGLQAVPVHPRDQMIQVLATSQYEKLLSTKKKEKKKPPSAIFTPYGVLVPMGLKASASTSSHYHTGPDQFGPPATATGYQSHDHHQQHHHPHHHSDMNEKELLNILLQANIGPFGQIGFHKKANLKNGRIKSHLGLRANLEPALDLLAEKLSLKLGALEYLIKAPHTAIGFHYSHPHHEYPKQESSYSEINPVKMYKAPSSKGKKEKGPSLKGNMNSSEFKMFIKQLLKERLYEMLDEARDENEQGGVPRTKGNFRSMKSRKRPSKENENSEGKMYPFPLQSVITPTQVPPPKPPVRSKGFFSTIKNLFSFGRDPGPNPPGRTNGTNMWEFKSAPPPVFKATQAPELEKILNSKKPDDQTGQGTTKQKEMKKLESKKKKEVKEKPDNKMASKDFNKWLDLVLKSAADSKFSSAEKKLVLEKLIFSKKGESEGWRPKKSDKEEEDDMVGAETKQIGVKVPPPPSFFNFTGGKWWKEEMIPMSRASKWRPVFYLASPLHKNKQ